MAHLARSEAFKLRDVGQIGYQELRSVFENLHKEFPASAVELYRVLKTMYTWAFERELIGSNPMALLQAPGKYADRNRFLAPEERQKQRRRILERARGVKEPFPTREEFVQALEEQLDEETKLVLLSKLMQLDGIKRQLAYLDAKGQGLEETERTGETDETD